MLKKFAVGALAALLLASGASLAVAGNGDDGDDDDGRTIRLIARSVTDAELDLGETGFGAGDRFVFSEDLYRDDEKVGESGGECTIVRIVDEVATANCLASLTLPGGQITVQGLAEFSEENPPVTVAITGGSGRYREADGEFTVETISDTEDRFTIRLR
jgi:hypothetical protein